MRSVIEEIRVQTEAAMASARSQAVAAHAASGFTYEASSSCFWLAFAEAKATDDMGICACASAYTGANCSVCALGHTDDSSGSCVGRAELAR